MVYIGESGQGVSSKSMYTWEVPYKLPFQECGTTFLADLGVQMAWFLFFFSQFDALHISLGHPLGANTEQIRTFSGFCQFFVQCTKISLRRGGGGG